MSGIELLRKHPLVIGLIAFVAGYAGFLWAAKLPFAESSWGQAIVEIICGIVILAVMAALGGTQCIRPSGKGIRYGLLKSRYLLLWIVALGVMILLAAFYQGMSESGFNSDWPSKLLATAVLCIGVGIFEEGLCRGLLFGALLSKMGSTRTGIVWAVIISSAVFGFIHVWPNFARGELNSLLTWAQALDKTFLGTGAFGALMAVIYLRTHNLWAVALVHGLNDFITMAPMSLATNAPDIHYVTADPNQALMSLAVGLVIFLIIYLPIIIKIIPTLKNTVPPQLGPWTDHWQALVPEPEPKRAKKSAKALEHTI